MAAIAQWGDFNEAKTTFEVDNTAGGSPLTADPTDNQRVIALRGQSRIALQIDYTKDTSTDLQIVIEIATEQDPDTFYALTNLNLTTGAITLTPDLEITTTGVYNPLLDLLQGYRKIRIGLFCVTPGGSPSVVIVNFSTDSIRQT